MCLWLMSSSAHQQREGPREGLRLGHPSPWPRVSLVCWLTAASSEGLPTGLFYWPKCSHPLAAPDLMPSGCWACPALLLAPGCCCGGGGGGSSSIVPPASCPGFHSCSITGVILPTSHAAFIWQMFMSAYYMPHGEQNKFHALVGLGLCVCARACAQTINRTVKARCGRGRRPRGAVSWRGGS